jgi:dephospho-CoA kinase
MHVLGLTGGIAMGKSTAAAAFRRAHIPVFDADQTVHRLQARGGAAVRPIGAAFPGTVIAGAIDRPELRRAVLGQPGELTRLEAIMHPLIREACRRFLARHRHAGARLVVLDIPLLFETGWRAHVDLVAVVTAPASLQAQRLRRRRGMTPLQIKAVLARQMTDHDRRRLADVLIRTGLSRYNAQRQVRRLIARLRKVRALPPNPNSLRARALSEMGFGVP